MFPKIVHVVAVVAAAVVAVVVQPSPERIEAAVAAVSDARGLVRAQVAAVAVVLPLPILAGKLHQLE